MTEIFNALVTPDGELWACIGLSFVYATVATAIAAVPALWAAYSVAGNPTAPRQWLRRFCADAIQATVAIPAMAIGLVVYLMTSERGPLAFLHAAFHPAGMLLVEILLAAPLLTALFARIFADLAPQFAELALSCGATPNQVRISLIRQAWPALIGAALLGWTRIIGEAGAAAIIGGNLAGSTRVLPTAMALEIQHGDPGRAIGMGVVLLGTAFAGTVLLRQVKRL